MKILWRFLFLVGVFLTLYFFGNFRINDVNVRDFLQSKITVQQMKAMGRRAADLFEMLAGLIRQKSDSPSDKKSSDKVDNFTLHEMGLDNAKELLIGDSLTEEDRKKILKIIEQNLSPGTAATSTNTGKKDK